MKKLPIYNLPLFGRTPPRSEKFPVRGGPRPEKNLQKCQNRKIEKDKKRKSKMKMKIWTEGGSGTPTKKGGGILSRGKLITPFSVRNVAIVALESDSA